MARLTVLTVPDPRLRIRAKPVLIIDDAIRCLLDDMIETMAEEEGCGLAAPQVGIDARVIVVDVRHVLPDSTVYKMVNPEILYASDEHDTCSEGCLSVPNASADVARPKSIRVTYLDENGDQHTLECDDLLARAIQHEIDHLNGKIYIDYLSSLKRQIILNKVKRFKRHDS
jgi:peptide deformylase